MLKYMFVLALLITSCSGSNEFGECVGLSEDSRVSTLKYELSTRNMIWSILGFETIIAPALWATEYAYCPIGVK